MKKLFGVSDIRSMDTAEPNASSVANPDAPTESLADNSVLERVDQMDGPGSADLAHPVEESNSLVRVASSGPTLKRERSLPLSTSEDVGAHYAGDDSSHGIEAGNRPPDRPVDKPLDHGHEPPRAIHRRVATLDGGEKVKPLGHGLEPPRAAHRRVATLDNRALSDSRGSSSGSGVSDELEELQRSGMVRPEEQHYAKHPAGRSFAEQARDSEMEDEQAVSRGKSGIPKENVRSEQPHPSNENRRHGDPTMRSPKGGIDLSRRADESKSVNSSSNRVLGRVPSGHSAEVHRGVQGRVPMVERREKSRGSSPGSAHEPSNILDGPREFGLQPPMEKLVPSESRQRPQAPSRSPQSGIEPAGLPEKYAVGDLAVERPPDRVVRTNVEPARVNHRRIAVIDGRGRSRGSSTGSTVLEDPTSSSEDVRDNHEQSKDHYHGTGHERASLAAGDPIAYESPLIPATAMVAMPPSIPPHLSLPQSRSRKHDRTPSRSPPSGTDPTRGAERVFSRDEGNGRAHDQPLATGSEKNRSNQPRIAVVDGRVRSRGSSVGSVASEDVNKGGQRRIVHVDGRQRGSKASSRNAAVDELAPGRLKGYILIGAAAKGQLDRVRQILNEDSALVNFENYDKRTPLHLASAEDHSTVARELVERGANMDLLDRHGRTPVEEAILWGNTRTLRVFEKSGAAFPNGIDPLSVDSKYWHGRDLLEAAGKGNLKAVKQLVLIFGTDLNWQNADGRTATHLACVNRHKNIVEFMLQRGADPFLKDRRDITAIDEAKVSGDTELYLLFADVKQGTIDTHRKNRTEVNPTMEGRMRKVEGIKKPEIRVITSKEPKENAR